MDHQGYRRGRVVLGGQPPTLDVIENPLFEGSSSSRNMLPSWSSAGGAMASYGGGGSSYSPAVSRQVSERPGSSSASEKRRPLTRMESINRYIKKSTASFFGLDEESAQESCQRWTLRRKRLLSKKCGDIKEQYLRSKDWHLSHLQPLSQPVRVSLSQDTTDSARRKAAGQQNLSEPFRRDSVCRMTWNGLTFLTNEVKKRLSSYDSQPTRGPRKSFSPSADDSIFSEDIPETGLPKSQMYPLLEGDELVDEVFFEKPSSTTQLEWHASRTSTDLPGSRQVASVHQRPRFNTWHRPSSVIEEPDSPEVGMTRIWERLLNKALDNSDRREYGIGIAGRLFQRSFRRDRITPDVRNQLENIEDHRPFFTYWVTTVQILITIISLAVYGFGPVGFHKTQRTGLVMVTTLTLQQVDFPEPDNFWIGPRAADLVHLGAKFTPCMRRDRKIHDKIGKDRRKERNTACCVRNDRSGCVQTSRDKCSEVISTWRKWNVSQPGPPRKIVSDHSALGSDREVSQRRLSGSVCGQDPRYCEEPASVFPYEWPDDITKWPVCRRPLSGRKAPELHMSCEVVGRPCCIGVYGECRITTKDYCDFVKGFFHEEAALCSQVSCLNDICGMIPFHNPEVPDQFYRLWTSLFLHAGIIHLIITVIVQYFIMRDLEKLAGPVRIGIIYISSGVAGNLASAIFVPYRAEVGPAGSQFGLLACLFVEVIHCWQMLKRPSIALYKLAGVAVGLFVIGLLPWVDNYAHLFGFIFGFLLSYALLPFVSFGSYDRTTKVILIWACLIVVVALFIGLVVLFYVHPIYECSFCHYFNCLPLTRDLCDTHQINFTRPEW